MNKRDLEAKKRWTKLRTKTSYAWCDDLSASTAQLAIEYMSGLLNKRVLVPLGKASKFIRVIGVEVGSSYIYNEDFDNCVISGMTDDGQFAQFYFSYCMNPVRYPVDDNGFDLSSNTKAIIWWAGTPKFRAMLLAQELERT